MLIAENTVLFSIIGNTYGGNGTTDFALLKLPPLTPVGPFSCICLEARSRMERRPEKRPRGRVRDVPLV